MPYTVILHIQGSEPVTAEMEELPSSQDTLVIVKNPRRTDGKELHYLNHDAITVAWPIERLNFLEIISGAEAEEIIGFVRE